MKLFGDKLRSRITSPPRESRNGGLRDSVISNSKGGSAKHLPKASQKDPNGGSGRNSGRSSATANQNRSDPTKVSFLSTLPSIDPNLKGMAAVIEYQKQNKVLMDAYKQLEGVCNDQTLQIKELTILCESKKISKQSELQEKHEVVIKQLIQTEKLFGQVNQAYKEAIERKNKYKAQMNEFANQVAEEEQNYKVLENNMNFKLNEETKSLEKAKSTLEKT